MTLTVEYISGVETTCYRIWNDLTDVTREAVELYLACSDTDPFEIGMKGQVIVLANDYIEGDIATLAGVVNHYALHVKPPLDWRFDGLIQQLRVATLIPPEWDSRYLEELIEKRLTLQA